MRMQAQQGVVMVVALFFMALVATLSYYMMLRLEKDTERTRLILRNQQASLYAQGSVDWAKNQLRDNLVFQKPNKPVDTLPLHSPINHVRGYAISSVIYDAQARFNINHLSNPVDMADFRRLLGMVYPRLTDQAALPLLQAIVDWISSEQKQSPYQQYYAELSPPYRAAHRPMVSVAELQWVKGMTPALFTALKPYVIALPSRAPVNFQTAPAAILAALSPSMTMDTGKALEKARLQLQAPTIQAFLGLDIVKNHSLPAEKLTAVSDYFLVETKVSIEKQETVLYTLLERTGKNDQVAVHSLWQSLGTL